VDTVCKEGDQGGGKGSIGDVVEVEVVVVVVVNGNKRESMRRKEWAATGIWQGKAGRSHASIENKRL